MTYSINNSLDIIAIYGNSDVFQSVSGLRQIAYKNKYKLSQIAKKIINESDSKSNLIIQNQNGLNYNGCFNKLLSLPITLTGFEIGLQKTIINIK